MQLADFSGLTAKPPEKRLLAPLKHSGGRNNRGRMTSRHRGGGHKRRLRLIDFKRNHDGVPATVAALEYDPNRSANIALLHYADGEKRYILAPEGLNAGDKVESGPQADIKPGNAMALRNIPLGTMVHGVELKPGADNLLAVRVINAAHDDIDGIRMAEVAVGRREYPKPVDNAFSMASSCG